MVEERRLWIGSGGLRVTGRPILRETGHDQRRESKSEHHQTTTETPREPPGFHGRPKCSNWKMTDHATYFQHIVRDRAWSSSRARITEVSHFFITAALPLSKRPGVLMICRSLGMSSDQLEKTPFRGHIKNHIAGMERGLTARRAASGIGVGLDAVTSGLSCDCRRNEIERLFRRLKGFRRIFSRFDKPDVVFLAFLHFALIIEALRSLNSVNTP